MCCLHSHTLCFLQSSKFLVCTCSKKIFLIQLLRQKSHIKKALIAVVTNESETAMDVSYIIWRKKVNQNLIKWWDLVSLLTQEEGLLGALKWLKISLIWLGPVAIAPCPLIKPKFPVQWQLNHKISSSLFLQFLFLTVPWSISFYISWLWFYY